MRKAYMVVLLLNAALACPVCGSWILADYHPGFDLNQLSDEGRAEIQLQVEQMRLSARFEFKADSSYTFSVGKKEFGYYTYTKEYILTDHGASRPDTLRIVKHTVDSLVLRMHDQVTDLDYTFTLVPAFQLKGMAIHLPGKWTISRVEYDSREIADEAYEKLLREEVQKLKLNSRFVFRKDGSFYIRMLGSENEGTYQVNGTKLITTEAGGTSTVFTIAAASDRAILLLSHDPQRSPKTLQLVLIPEEQKLDY